MSVESPLYPYQRGRGGIPFSEILKGFSSGEIHGTIQGGSGKDLLYKINPRLVKIEDKGKRAFRLWAEVDQKGQAEFEIFTEFPEGHKHPDLYAARFITFSLDFFESQGTEVSVCAADWFENGALYHSFMNAWERTGSRAEAAASLWSGQVFAKNGFTQITDFDVSIIRGQGELQSYVIARFHRG